MNTGTNPAAIDRGHVSRPGLALLLAILSVPGSTVAWDLELPMPGLWIGLPLGCAAIVLALRARESDGSTKTTTAAIVLAGLAIAQMAVYFLVLAVS